MNLIDAVVVQILSKPYEQFGKWWVDVEVESYGRITTSQVMFHKEHEAKQMKVGKVIQI